MAATPIDTVTVFDCPICLEKLSIPKYLPCLHTFCKLCIQTFIEKFKKKSSFPCPVCRLEVSTPEANITSEEWACKLPLNHLLLSLQDALEKSNSQGDVLCEPCKRASEKKNAKFYCRDCMDSLCENCLTYHHRRIRHYKSHKVTDISKYPQEVMTKELIVEEPCMIHKNKVLEVYCFDHETLCCSVCFATLHRKCDEVQSLEEVVEKMGENIHPANINSALASIKAKADTEINKTKNNFKQLEHKHAQIVETVVAHVEEAKLKLETLKNTFIKDFQIMHDNEKSLLSNTEAFLVEFSKALARSEKILSVTVSNGSKRSLFLTVKRIKSEVFNHLDQLRKQTENQSIVDYNWEEKSIINKILAEESIGHLQVLKSERSIHANLQKEMGLFKKATSFQKHQESKLENTANNSSNVWSLPSLPPNAWSLPPQPPHKIQGQAKQVAFEKVLNTKHEYPSSIISEPNFPYHFFSDNQLSPMPNNSGPVVNEHSNILNHFANPFTHSDRIPPVQPVKIHEPFHNFSPEVCDARKSNMTFTAPPPAKSEGEMPFIQSLDNLWEMVRMPNASNCAEKSKTISEKKLCKTYPEPALQQSVNENKVSLNVSPSKPEGNPFSRAKPNTMKLPFS